MLTDRNIVLPYQGNARVAVEALPSGEVRIVIGRDGEHDYYVLVLDPAEAVQLRGAIDYVQGARRRRPSDQ